MAPLNINSTIPCITDARVTREWLVSQLLQERKNFKKFVLVFSDTEIYHAIVLHGFNPGGKLSRKK